MVNNMLFANSRIFCRKIHLIYYVGFYRIEIIAIFMSNEPELSCVKCSHLKLRDTSLISLIFYLILPLILNFWTIYGPFVVYLMSKRLYGNIWPFLSTPVIILRVFHEFNGKLKFDSQIK